MCQRDERIAIGFVEELEESHSRGNRINFRFVGSLSEMWQIGCHGEPQKISMFNFCSLPATPNGKSPASFHPVKLSVEQLHLRSFICVGIGIFRSYYTRAHTASPTTTGTESWGTLVGESRAPLEIFCTFSKLTIIDLFIYLRREASNGFCNEFWKCSIKSEGGPHFPLFPLVFVNDISFVVKSLPKSSK